MAVRIAEYLGQRTDVDFPAIKPTALYPEVVPTCPFMGGPCSKLKGKKSYPPVCSVRTGNGDLFVVCPDRVVPAKARVVTADHIHILGQVSSILFPGELDENVGYLRQVSFKVAGGRIFVDYVLRLNNPAFPGPQGVIVEVQGGGETSNTGTVTEHTKTWAATPGRDNELLRTRFPEVGLIPDNAWKRQLRQVFRKSPLASRFGGGFALILGPILFDYVRQTVTGGGEWYREWEVALIEVVEEPDDRFGPIPLRTGRAVFMAYADFVAFVAGTPLPDDVPNPFLGNYTSLLNERMSLFD